MRKGIANPGASTYFNPEVFLNNVKLISINSATERALAVAIVDAAGNQETSIASTGTTSSVADSASSVTLLSANTSRRGCILYNDSTEIAYVKFGTTASTTDFTIRLVPTATYEMTGIIYTGRIDAIWAANSTGSMRITELT